MIAKAYRSTKKWLLGTKSKFARSCSLSFISPLVACLVVFLVKSSAFGADGLVFKATTLDCTALGGETSISAVFEFTNQSTRPVRVKGIRTCCGCVEAKANATQYESGQEGRVNVIITPNKMLPQQKSIIVETDVPFSPRVVLLLRINLPEKESATEKSDLR